MTIQPRLAFLPLCAAVVAAAAAPNVTERARIDRLIDAVAELQNAEFLRAQLKAIDRR